MRVVGVTGGIACGKTTVANYLQSLGAAVVDADAISHALTAPGGEALPLIEKTFGKGVFFPSGDLDRKALARLVFSAKEARTQLNALMHPLVEARMRQEISTCREKGCPIVLLVVPLLYEAGIDTLADEVWCVSAPEALQIQRLKDRDGLTQEQALQRIRSQWPLAEKEKRADAVLCTSQPLEKVFMEAAQLYRAAAERSRE